MALSLLGLTADDDDISRTDRNCREEVRRGWERAVQQTAGDAPAAEVEQSPGSTALAAIARHRHVQGGARNQ